MNTNQSDPSVWSKTEPISPKKQGTHPPHATMATTTTKTKKQFAHEGHPSLQLMRDEWERFYWVMILRVRDDPAGITPEERRQMDAVLELQRKLWKISRRTGLTDGRDEVRRTAVRERVIAEREARAQEAERERLAGADGNDWSVNRLKVGRRQVLCEEVLRLCGLRQTNAVRSQLEGRGREIAELEA